VQDENHAYDLRHDAAQVWGLATGTYYAQALLQCHAAFQASGDDAFKLCVVVTDGQIDEDKYAQCDAGGRRSTMTYTSSMAGDYYDAGAEKGANPPPRRRAGVVAMVSRTSPPPRRRVDRTINRPRVRRRRAPSHARQQGLPWSPTDPAFQQALS
jgi:hypothetical protein